MVDLLVDDGISKRSHRKAIFQPNYIHIGVGVDSHTEHGGVIVVDYGAQIISHDEMAQVAEQATQDTEGVFEEDLSAVNFEELA